MRSILEAHDALGLEVEYLEYQVSRERFLERNSNVFHPKELREAFPLALEVARRLQSSRVPAREGIVLDEIHPYG